jgi:hypothetical protein
MPAANDVSPHRLPANARPHVWQTAAASPELMADVRLCGRLAFCRCRSCT